MPKFERVTVPIYAEYGENGFRIYYTTKKL
jgi:hypothetical protein